MTNSHPLTKALAAIGWSQGRLAVESGVAQSTISFAVRGLRGGKFSAETARKILDTVAAESRRPKHAGAEPARALRLEHLIFPHAPESKPRRRSAAA